MPTAGGAQGRGKATRVEALKGPILWKQGQATCLVRPEVRERAKHMRQQHLSGGKGGRMHRSHRTPLDEATPQEWLTDELP
jgi:hypothetical protein